MQILPIEIRLRQKQEVTIFFLFSFSSVPFIFTALLSGYPVVRIGVYFQNYKSIISKLKKAYFKIRRIGDFIFKSEPIKVLT